LILMWFVYFPFIFKIDNYYRLDFRKSDKTAFIRYFDGPFYAGIAKTLYDSHDTYFQNSSIEQQVYYTNHLPLYPLLIKLVGQVVPIEMGMLLVSQVCGMIGVLLFYYFLSSLLPLRDSLLLTIVSMILPQRALLLHNVGASEPLFIVILTLIIISLRAKRFELACVLTALAVLTRSTGLFLVPGLWIIWFVYYRWNFKKLLVTLFPVIAYLGLVYYWYQVVPGFHFFNRTGGFEFIINAPIFNMFFINSGPAEAIGFVSIGVVAGTLTLLKKESQVWKKQTAILLATGASFVLFSFHPDNMRYIYPYLSFLIIYPLRKIFTDKRFLAGMVFILPAMLMIVWVYLVTNQMPPDQTANWLNVLR